MSAATQNQVEDDAEWSAERSSIADEVIEGLSLTPKRIAPKYFYDQKGSTLFDAITDLDDYYVTRVEKNIFAKYRADICAAIGKGKVLVEPGAGSCEKIKWLLPELQPAAYVPMDISANHLRASADGFSKTNPELKVWPQACDHTIGMELDIALQAELGKAPPVFFYPGSSIGNFEPDAAVEFLCDMRAHMNGEGGLLIGVDAKKDEGVLHAAYNDVEGITAEFNVNVLNHLNRLLEGDLDSEKFLHHALYNKKYGRIEMHLRCTGHHLARLAGQQLEFTEGELIHTENSYKYHPDEFIALAQRAGFTHQKLWQDDRGWFSVMYFVPD